MYVAACNCILLENRFQPWWHHLYVVPFHRCHYFLFHICLDSLPLIFYHCHRMISDPNDLKLKVRTCLQHKPDPMMIMTTTLPAYQRSWLLIQKVVSMCFCRSPPVTRYTDSWLYVQNEENRSISYTQSREEMGNIAKCTQAQCSAQTETFSAELLYGVLLIKPLLCIRYGELVHEDSDFCNENYSIW